MDDFEKIHDADIEAEMLNQIRIKREEAIDREEENESGDGNKKYDSMDSLRLSG